ncbi:MAG: hypothetical protein V8T45_11215 [Oscillospiraceae bacterium]
MYLVDLPGYGYAKVSEQRKRALGQAYGDSLPRGLIDLGVMIVDSRHKPTADDVTMAQWFSIRLPCSGGCQQAGQAEKKRDDQKPGADT